MLVVYSRTYSNKLSEVNIAYRMHTIKKYSRNTMQSYL